ncbi:MAG: efflux RND transporter periplasmic adaptor subunit [Bacteroidales bacterium]|nr:efflux RND transporter periplasmic adaptor subunit [Bacteroidales bacterium]MCF6341818.1 efflux RND transporter periplasmic adaptor subunit [Bacteroidales bacterium]
MKKLFIIIIAAGFLFSCSNGKKNEGSVKEQIAAYEKELAEINGKIEELKQQLADEPDETTHQKIKTAVKTMTIRKQPFSHFFEATGELESVSEAFVSPEVSGQVTELNVVEGQWVKKGQLLAKLNTTIVEKNISEVKTQLNLAEIIFNKQKELWDKNIGSERQYLEAKNNYEGLQNKLSTLQAQYNMSIIRSPISGYVEQIILKKGEMATPGMQLMQIVNIDQLYVTTKLSEAYLSAVHIGDTVEIRFPSFPKLVLKKAIHRISNVLNKQNRTFIVQVKINNPNGLLKPNLLATIRINDYNSPASIVIPSILIKEDMKGSYLFVAEKNGQEWTARKKYVETGISDSNKTEVLSGLSEGQYVITDGYSNVSDGMSIRMT